MEKVFISIGSNVGDSIENCRRALSEISGFCEIIKVSSLYETEPVGKEDQPDFINAGAELRTGLEPHELLENLMETEKKLGRVRHEKWGPRIIDLDIIFYGGLILNEKDLIIPHPRAHQRRFVLEPISEIDPDFIFPGLEKTVLDMLRQISDNKEVVKLNDPFTILQQ